MAASLPMYGPFANIATRPTSTRRQLLAVTDASPMVGDSVWVCTLLLDCDPLSLVRGLLWSYREVCVKYRGCRCHSASQQSEVRGVGFGVWGKRPKFLVLALVRLNHHQHRRASQRVHDNDNRRRSRRSGDTHDNATIANMRTYDDTFSGQKIYPGKVRYPHHHDYTAI